MFESLIKSMSLFILIALVVNSARSDDLKVTKIDSVPLSNESQITFSNGDAISVSVVRIKPIAFLKSSIGEPRLLMSGASCTNCDMTDAIYLIPLKNQSSVLPRGVYPGNFKAYDTGKLIEKHRMFYGRCLSEKESVVWLSNFVGDDQEWHIRNSVIYVGDQHDEPVLLAIENASEVIARHVTNRECRELKGIDGFAEP